MEIKKDKQEYISSFIRRNWIGNLLCLAVGICIITAFVIHNTADIKDMRFDSEEATPLPGEFELAIGDEHSTVTLPATVDGKAGELMVLSKELKRSEIEGNALVMYIRQARVRIYLDGELLNESGPAITRPFPMLPCSYWYICRIPFDFQEGELRIEMIYEKDSYAKEMPQVYMGTKASFVYMVVEQALPSLILGIPAIIMGLALWVGGSLMRIRRLSRRMRRLGALALTVSIWYLLEARMSQVFSGNQAVMTYILFSCFYLIPLVASAFLLTYHCLAKRWYMCLIFWASFVFFLAAQILQITGLVNFIDMVYGMHVLTASIVVGVVFCYIGVRRNREENVDYGIFIAILLFGIFVVVDMIAYYLEPLENVGKFSRVGLLVFIFYLGYSALVQVSEQQRKVITQQVYKELAFSDLMTGIGNRTAMEREMEEIRKDGLKENLGILVADLNNLKYINDNYGHSMGDEAIVKTAAELRTSFSERCKCFRMGGDEFCVVGVGISREEMERMHQIFLRNMQALGENVSYPLMIASAYQMADGMEVDECLKQADAKMYEVKMQTKTHRMTAAEA